GLVGILYKMHAVAVDAPGVLHGYRVVRGDDAALGEQLVDEDERRRLPQVVGARLEGEAPDAESLAPQALGAEVRLGLLGEQPLLAVVDRVHRGEEGEVEALVARGRDERFDIFREAAPAVARAGKEELL